MVGVDFRQVDVVLRNVIRMLDFSQSDRCNLIRRQLSVLQDVSDRRRSASQISFRIRVQSERAFERRHSGARHWAA